MIITPERDSSDKPESNKKILRKIRNELIQIRKSLSGWKFIDVSKKETELSQEQKIQKKIASSKEDVQTQKKTSSFEEPVQKENKNIFSKLKDLFTKNKKDNKPPTKDADKKTKDVGKKDVKDVGEVTPKDVKKSSPKNVDECVAEETSDTVTKDNQKKTDFTEKEIPQKKEDEDKNVFSKFKDLFTKSKKNVKAPTKDVGKTAAKDVGEAATKDIGKTVAKGIGEEVADAAAKDVAKGAEKTAAKDVGKTSGKSLLKKIPLFGLGAGLVFGAERFFNGDILGGFGEIASGIASIIPGWGTAASFGIDAALLTKDLNDAGVFGSQDVPQMADGGVVSQPTLALIGENKEREYIIPESKLGLVSNFDSPLKEVGKDILGVSSNYVSQFGTSKLLPYIGSDLIEYQRIYGNDREIIPIFTKNEGKFPDIKTSPLMDVFSGTKQNINENILLQSFNNVLDALDASSLSLGLPKAQTKAQTKSVGKSDFSGSDNQEKVFNFFVSKGLSDFQAAAFVGNFMVEGTPSINPSAVNPSSGATGVAQWLGSRLEGLQDFAKRNNLPVDKIEAQLEYAWYELNNDEKSAFEVIKNTSNLEDAVNAVRAEYERPEKNDANDAARLSYARDFLSSRQNKPTSKLSSVYSGTLGSNAPLNDGKILIPVKDSYGVSSRYGWRTDPITGETKFHNGVDLAAATGTPVYASESGIIEYANEGDNGGYGNMIELRGSSYKHTYAHLNSIFVKEGQYINAGDKIGEIGSTGSSTGPHLHWEVLDIQRNERLDGLDVSGSGSYNDSVLNPTINPVPNQYEIPSESYDNTDLIRSIENARNKSRVSTNYSPSYSQTNISPVQKSQGNMIAFVPFIYPQTSPSTTNIPKSTNLSPELSNYTSLNQFTPQIMS